MNALIVPISPTKNLSEITEFSSLTDEEEQLAFDEQLMLEACASSHDDREIYYQDSQY